jgi:hypothetical protein
MAAIKLMIIDNVTTTYGADQRCVYVRHLLNDGFIEFHDTYNPYVFFEIAKTYLVDIDDTIVSFEGAVVKRVMG